ncbi:MAG: dipeptidase [Planctomycetia bacterium]|nr:dipeptidase [Planctomycetia bacterium]
MENLFDYIDQNRERYREYWFNGLRIPSVSAEKKHKPDMLRMAEYLLRFLREELKFEGRLIEGEGNPLVYAESPAVEGAPTVLLYGHYDVQPADPLDLWKSDPFEPEIRGENVYARGADDDKGQIFAHLSGIKALMEREGRLPIRIKCIFEGEEEVGSDHLFAFLHGPEGKELLAADLIVVSDNTMAGPGQPAITYGLRGVIGFEVFFHGPNRDLHSGIYGGSVCNPALALSRALAGLMDEKGKIQIPGFYDGVRAITDQEHSVIAQVPFDEEQAKKDLGVSAFFGDPDYTIMERRCARPSFDINGLTSGYQGEGGKTIIPSWASVKFTLRVVPDQNVEKIIQATEDFFRAQVPSGIRMDFHRQQGAEGMVVPLESPYVAVASHVLETVHGKKPLFVRDGGSITIVAELWKVLNADLLMIGLGLDEDAIHSPNEHFSLDCFYNGIKTGAQLWTELAKMKK